MNATPQAISQQALMDKWMNTLQKRASSTAAEVSDPTDKGTVSIPKPVDDSSAERGVPAPAPVNSDMSPKEANPLMTQTQPAGTGEGKYPTPENGNAKDNISSAGSPLSKMAARLLNVQNSISSIGGKQPQEKKATAESQEVLNPSMAPDILLKMAHTMQLAVATEEGAEYVKRLLEKQAGVQEASKMIADAIEGADYLNSLQGAALEKAGSAVSNYASNYQASEMMKGASAQEVALMEKSAATHKKVLESTVIPPMYKMAYAMGPADAAAQFDAGEGEDPKIVGEDAEDLSIEEVVAGLTELVESGQMTEEEATGIAQSLAGGQEGDDELTMEQIQEAIASGAITVDQIAQILASAGLAPEQIAELMSGLSTEGAAPVEGAPEISEEEVIEKAASAIVSSIFAK